MDRVQMDVPALNDDDADKYANNVAGVNVKIKDC